MRPNKLREKLKKDEPTFGTQILSTYPGWMEVLAATGEIDYVQFVAEYAPFDLYALENMGRGCAAAGISGMIKVDQEPKTYLATRGLGAGFHSVLFCDIRSVEYTRECVASVHMEDPTHKGIHGCHARWSVDYGLESGTWEYQNAMNEAVIALMIEKKGAIENIEEILSVEGVDMIQFGPCDYSISIGKDFNPNHPEVMAAEKKAIKTALDKGVRPRTELGWNWTEKRLNYMLDLGVKDFCNGFEPSLLYEWVKENNSKVREILMRRLTRK